MSADPQQSARVRRVATTRLPTRHADFVDPRLPRRADRATTTSCWPSATSRTPASGPPLVRLHSECLTGDALGSLRCDCGEQLDPAQAAVAAEGRGAVVYLRGHEGRGIGLSAKLRAYALQDDGLDTLDANLALGLPADAREYGAAVAMLDDLGVHADPAAVVQPGQGERAARHGHASRGADRAAA